jgi:hypothetical protein
MFLKNNLNRARIFAAAVFGLFLCATSIARTITFVPQSRGFDSQGYNFAPEARYGITLSCVDEKGVPTVLSNGGTQFGKLDELLSFDGLAPGSVCDFLLISPTVPEGLAGAFNPPTGKKRPLDSSQTLVFVEMELYLPKLVGVTLVLDVPAEIATLAVSAQLDCYAFAIDAVAVKNGALPNGGRLELKSIPKGAACIIYVNNNAIDKALLNTPYVLTSITSTLPRTLDQDTEAIVTVKIERSVQIRVSTASNIAAANLVSDVSLNCDGPNNYFQVLNFFKIRAAHVVGNELVFSGVPPGFSCRVLGVRPTVAVPGYTLLEITVTTYFKSPQIFDADFVIGLYYRYLPTRTFTILNSVDGSPPNLTLADVEINGNCSPAEITTNFLLRGSPRDALTTTRSFPVGARCYLGRVNYTSTPVGYVWKRHPPGPLYSFYGPELLTIEENGTNTVSLVHTLVETNSALEIELGIPTTLDFDISTLRAVATCNVSEVYYSTTNVFVSEPPERLAEGKYVIKIRKLSPNIRCDLGFSGIPEPPPGVLFKRNAAPEKRNQYWPREL